jgi:uncharacterized protein YkwD
MKLMKTLFACAVTIAGSSVCQGQSRTAWGVDAQDVIYRYNGQWTVMPGLLRHISVSQDNNVWGVAGNETVWRWNGQGWDNMPGLLVQISVGAKGHIWGVSRGNELWRWNENTNWWDRMNGAGKQLSVASDGSMFVVGLNNDLYKWLGADYQFIPGNTLQVAVGSVSNVWKIDTQNSVYRYNPAKSPEPWDAVAGKLKQISVSADGEVWGVDMNGALVRRNGEAWEPLQKTLAQVSVGSPIAAPSGGNTARPGRIEEDDPSISYSGPWGRLPDGSASGGSYMVASQTGATMTVRFTGDTIAIYRRMDTDGGNFNVRIDNKDCGSFSSYFSERRWRVPAVLHGVGVGEHTLVLTLEAARPAGSSGSNVYFDALEAPAPFPPNTSQEKGIGRLNAVRVQMGLPPARLAPALNLAAQAHAEYLAQNPGSGHFQRPGAAGFFGVDPMDRLRYYGYNGGVGEDIWPGQDGALMVDNVFNSVYHRLPVVDYDGTEVGFGINAQGQGVLDVGYKYRPQRPATRLLATYPYDNQTGVRVQWDAGENPQPLPGKARPFGALLSLHITQPANAARGTDTTALSGTVRGEDGLEVPVYLISKATDSAGILGAGDFFLIPQRPLAYGTAYTATLTGTDEKNNAFTKQWKFTTIVAATITSVEANAEGSGAVIYWWQAGPVVSTKIAWGTTASLGPEVPGEGNPAEAEPTVFRAVFSNLNAGTYYYQITSTDRKGNVVKTPVATFVMPARP